MSGFYRQAQTYIVRMMPLKSLNMWNGINPEYVSRYAKQRANGVCQLCNQKAPFLDANGEPYLEQHHIVWLSKDEEDTVGNTVALCPNCHRKMHVVNDPKDVAALKKVNTT